MPSSSSSSRVVLLLPCLSITLPPVFSMLLDCETPEPDVQLATRATLSTNIPFPVNISALSAKDSIPTAVPGFGVMAFQYGPHSQERDVLHAIPDNSDAEKFTFDPRLVDLPASTIAPRERVPKEMMEMAVRGVQHLKQQFVLEAKKEQYPADIYAAGGSSDVKKPIDERYIRRLVRMLDGGLLILTCLSAPKKLLDDTGVTSLETDTMFKRVAGDVNKGEPSPSLAPIPMVQAPHSTSDFTASFEQVGNHRQTSRVQTFGHLQQYHCEELRHGSQRKSLGARLFFKLNDPRIQCAQQRYSGGGSHPGYYQALYDSCQTVSSFHGDVDYGALNVYSSGVLDLKSLVSEEDHRRLMDFVYIDSAEKMEEFSQFVVILKEPKVQAWWDHKVMSKRILPCLIKSQSPMSTEDWDNTPVTASTGEAQHHWTGSRTGIKLSLVEAIESARKVDEPREIEIALKSGVLMTQRVIPSYGTQVPRVSRVCRRTGSPRNGDRWRERGAECLSNALKGLSSAQVGNSQIPQPRSAVVRTVVVGSNSSGRVTTRTIPTTPPVASTSSLGLLATDLSEASAPSLLSISEAQASAYLQHQQSAMTLPSTLTSLLWPPILRLYGLLFPGRLLAPPPSKKQSRNAVPLFVVIRPIDGGEAEDLRNDAGEDLPGVGLLGLHAKAGLGREVRAVVEDSIAAREDEIAPESNNARVDFYRSANIAAGDHADFWGCAIESVVNSWLGCGGRHADEHPQPHGSLQAPTPRKKCIRLYTVSALLNSTRITTGVNLLWFSMNVYTCMYEIFRWVTGSANVQRPPATVLRPHQGSTAENVALSRLAWQAFGDRYGKGGPHNVRERGFRAQRRPRYRSQSLEVGLDTGQPAGTKHPTRTRNRHFRTRRGSGSKPVRVYPRVVNYPYGFPRGW
ncbi:hypothetical protein B0H14DRAFT_2639822 [Mycena olivaceomarginata]|nr:hypothetical protein B0H14DRAFT_2639822 [Mycena olivaceomarginata]